MAGPEDNSSLSLDPSMEELFAEAVASVERHKKPAPGQGDEPLPDSQGSNPDEALELDLGAPGLELAQSASFPIEDPEGFDFDDEDSLGESPVFPGEKEEQESTPSHKETASGEDQGSPLEVDLQEALVNLETAESELAEVKERLAKREREVAAMVKRFEEAQRLYRAKVNEARQSGELVRELRERNEHLGGEMRKAIDRIKRQNAQVEALRRRYGKERDELKRYGSEKPFMALLSVVDNFTRALEHTGENAGALREGVEIIHSQFLSVLEGFGVTQVPCKRGDTFDPNHQEAMVRVSTTDVPNGAVVDILQTGYTYHERLLRPVRVSVSLNESLPPPSPPEEPTEASLEAPEEDPLDAVIAEVEQERERAEEGPPEATAPDPLPSAPEGKMDDGEEPGIMAPQSVPQVEADAPETTSPTLKTDEG